MKKDNTGQNTSLMFRQWKEVSSLFKEARHPHMAKAALNMLTHTAAGNWQKTESHECS
jgi:hypothetical protein